MVGITFEAGGSGWRTHCEESHVGTLSTKAFGAGDRGAAVVALPTGEEIQPLGWAEH